MSFIEMFRQFRDNLRRSWASLTTSARVQLVLTGLATIALVVLVVAWGATPQYVTLFSGLSAEDSALIRGKLTEQDVPFKIEGKGSIIQVPKERATTLRIDMAAEGIPASHSGVGFEIFDSSDLMTSKYVNDVNFKRAVMGTLQQMLNGLDFVKSSKVYITFAEHDPFTFQQEPSKAAVTLDVTAKPSGRQVEGLLGIITSFGPVNLTRDTVTLTMTDGTVLNAPGSDEFDAVTDKMLEMNRAFEREFKKKAEEALAAINVAAVVSVSVERDFSRQSQYKEEFEKGQVVSREEDSTEVTNREGPPQGPAGAFSNLPDEDKVIPGGTQTSEKTESSLENLELPSTVTTTEEAVGRIKAVTASASVGAKRVEALDEDGNPTGEVAYVKRSDEEIEHYKTTIASNIGYGMTKDDVEIAALDYPLEPMPFGAGNDMEIAQNRDWVDRMNDLTARITQNPFVWYGTRILLLLAALYIARWLVKQSMEEGPPVENKFADAAVTEYELSQEDQRKREIAEEVGKISQQEPEAVAALLRTWLTEDEANG